MNEQIELARRAVEWFESRGIDACYNDSGQVTLIICGDQMLDEIHVEISANEIVYRAGLGYS